jgi:DNA polymerase III delta prime subunit
VNLTIASVPLVVDMHSIRVDQLCVWDGRFAADIASCDPVPLARWLRFEDQPYLPGALDRILQEARRDRAEYGLSQLSLVVAFLRWHNLKEGAPGGAEQAERIASPLLMLPVELTRKKGVRDQYLLEAATSEAQVNPTLRHHLRQLYGIVLPETVDLRETPIEQFHAQISAQIAQSEPGVQLRLVKQPEIAVIHQRARQRLEQFKRRTRVRTPSAVPVAAQEFSYAQDDFRPLGLQLFHARVRPVPLPLRDAVGAPPQPRAPQMAAAVADRTDKTDETERKTLALRESSGNPYQWDIDLTAVTLGNFNHRKMSLVRDYSGLAESDLASEAFDRVFSLQPRQVDAEAPPALPLPEQWPVVQGDATQTAAVALARTGTSYIIQGPPGTGKSQTITNLIADYVGRGQRVLFVCEKRAAIDVVFHRLRQQGLDELCCMIHDSQGDKKTFVQNLRKTYEQWLAKRPRRWTHESAERTRVLDAMALDLQALERFDAAMRDVPAHIAVTVRDAGGAAHCVEGARSLRSRRCRPRPCPPSRRGATMRNWSSRLHLAVTESLGAPICRAACVRAARALVAQAGEAAGAAGRTQRARRRAERHLHAMRLSDAWPPLGGCDKALWRDALAVVADARRVATLAARGQLAPARWRAPERASRSATPWRSAAVCSRSSNEARCSAPPIGATGSRPPTPKPDSRRPARSRARCCAGCSRRGGACRASSSAATISRRMPCVRGPASCSKTCWPSTRARAALAQAGRRRSRPTTAARTPTPSCSSCEAMRNVDATAVACARRSTRTCAPMPRALRARRSKSSPPPATRTDALDALSHDLLDDPGTQPLNALEALARTLREQADALPSVLPRCRNWPMPTRPLAAALRTLAAVAPDAIEYAVAREGARARVPRRALAAALRRRRARAPCAAPGRRRERQLLDRNARTLAAAVRQRFRENVRTSALPASQLDADGKLFKKSYNAGAANSNTSSARPCATRPSANWPAATPAAWCAT